MTAVFNRITLRTHCDFSAIERLGTTFADGRNVERPKSSCAHPSALQTKLDSGVTTLCRCWNLTRRDGVVLGFTDHDATWSSAA